MSAPEFHHYESRDALMHSLADQVADQLTKLLETQEKVTLSVPGGTTPVPFFHALRVKPLDWARIRVVLNDERFVPESSERSNTRLLKNELLRDQAAHAEVIAFYLEAEAPEDVLGEITASITKALPLDVLVLGMGADMHTASLFPGADRLEEALSDNAPPVLPMRAENAPEPRLTLTAPILKMARHKHILIAGHEKERALKQALDIKTESEAPIRVALTSDNPAQIHYAD